MNIRIEQVHPSLVVDGPTLQRAVERTIAGEKVGVEDLTIVLADHDTVHDLNRQYLGHDYETDVLSFSLADEEHPADIEGEVYVDLDTAAERAPEFGSSFQEEATRYAVHGVLHLIGYDDATPEQKQAMHLLEDRYLAG